MSASCHIILQKGFVSFTLVHELGCSRRFHTLSTILNKRWNTVQDQFLSKVLAFSTCGNSQLLMHFLLFPSFDGVEIYYTTVTVFDYITTTSFSAARCNGLLGVILHLHNYIKTIWSLLSDADMFRWGCFVIIIAVFESSSQFFLFILTISLLIVF